MRAWAVLVCCSCSFRHGIGPGDGQNVIVDLAPPVDALWWNPAWRSRMPVAITNNAAGQLPAGYQVGLAYDLDAAPCTSNRDDIRIVRDNVDIERVIDEVGTVEWTWFPLAAAIDPSATANDYWLYCGNPSPTPAPSDPKMVFDAYDGFDTTIDTSVWTKQNTTSVVNGQLVCGGGGQTDNGVVTKTRTFSANHAVDYVATASSATASDWWAGFQIGTMDVAPWLHWYTLNPNAVCPDFLGVATDTPWYGTDIPLDTAPHFYSIENYGTKSMYRREDVPVQSHVYAPMQPPPAQVNVRLWNYSDSTSVTYDWVRVRQAIDPPPTTTVGAPETY
jgi:hypothetical protein